MANLIWTLRHLLLAILFAGATMAAQPAFAQRADTPRPTADSVSEDVFRGGRIEGRVTIPDPRAAFLEQPQGRDWRAFHESWAPWIGGIAILGMILGLAIFFFWRGRIRLAPEERTGGTITRFTFLERFSHWLVATSFIVLGLTGLNYVFGKRVLMPLIGPQAFGDLSLWGKYAHNFFAWPFVLGVILMAGLWTRDNLPSRVDWAWLKAGGGFISGRRVSAGRFNAGQKIMFWSTIIGTLIMFGTGLSLLFPFSLAAVNGMQVVQAVHSVIGLLFVAGILAHIYIGSLGMEGSFSAMGTGEVNVDWARHHHDQWVEQQQREGRAPPPPSGRGAPAAARPERA